MVRVYVIGVGMTKFDKPGKRDDDYPEWGKEAILSALQDAKINFDQVELAAAGYVYGDSTCGQRVIYEVGMTGIPVFNVNNNCSTGSSALLIAKEMVESGKYNCALAVGFEKMQRGSLTSQFNDRANPMMKHVEAMSNLADIDGSPMTAQMFGNAGIEHMNKYGTKPEHFAKIAYKNHKHSVNNPKSQFRDLYTLEQIMQSPKVYGPLTKLQCCPTSDGAAAAIVVSESFVKKHGLEGQAVEILGMEMATDLPSTFNANSHICIVGYDMSKLAADRLFAKTGKRPSDVQVVELHDCFSANELITYEALGLCPPGKAGEMIDRGDNTYGGKYVINPSGGLISKGHPLGATGLAQCAELCWQLRGEAGPRQVPGAKLALQHNIVFYHLLSLTIYDAIQNYGPSSQPEAYFNGSSYLRLLTTVSLKKQTGLSFRTCANGGTLFSQTQNDDVIELIVTAEGLVFVAKTAGKTYEHKIRGSFINNKWHTVFLQYKLGNLTMDVDGETQLIANSSYRSDLLVSPGLYNEGAAVLLVGNHFDGCILEGPSIVFDPNIVLTTQNVLFEPCPLPYDSFPNERAATQDFCVTEPCMRHGTCLSGTNSYTCVCAPRYTGKNCEMDLGNLCEKKTPYCKPNPCLNGGVCTDGFANFTCDCGHTGFKGVRCEVNVDECDATPCFNGGTCFDTYGSFLCQCADGFAGKNCQDVINDCDSRPCFNNGVCVSRVGGGYECRCLQGFFGDHCEVEQSKQTHCDNELCGPYAECVETSGSAACVCKPEYHGEYPNCNGDSVCIKNPCLNGGICTPYKSTFNCTCQPGFTGKFCQTNINECLTNPCLNGGTCMDKINGFICNCTDDWMGTYCERPFNICELNPCNNNATCTLASNKLDFVCHCLPGFEGKLCETNIDNCKGNKCPPAQTCHDLVNSYECRCPPGFTGEDCTIDIDPCSKNPCINGTCIVDKTTHQFSCDCKEGFTGALCEVDIDECAVSGNKICSHGICVNSEGSFQCYCMPGYTGERCNLDFDECLSMPCKNNATCLNLINKYECKCQPGYEGKDCELNINECEPNPCMNGARCIDGVNEFTCVCQQGLTGKTCEINIDDCASSPCLHGAKCIDGLNSYTCDCLDTGYEGEHCENNIDDCKGNPCQNHAHCIDKVKDYDCECYSGYRGKNCEMDENECESNPCQYNGTCLERSNATLYQPEIANYLNFPLPEVFNKPFNYAEAAGYECVCVPGVTGKNCETNINECDSNPCHYGTCTDKIGGYVCECEDGYEGEHCEIDIDECEKYKPCIQGTCIDKVANYYCKCASGYGGKNCSVALTGCENKPCLNKGVCWPYLVEETQHRFNCTCPNGYHGLTCEQKTTMSLNGNSLITVNSTKEEGYDIQFRFKTTLGDGLLALGKGITYYILELSKGRLNLHSSLLNKWEGVFIGSNLNDSKWQKVFVAINSSHLVLSANDEQTIYPISYNENNNATSTGFPVTYIGGFPSNLRKLTHGQPFLVGCTEDILINGEWVLPQERSTPWVSFQNVEVGCIREPQCKPNPCHSGGHCTDKPYLGHTCQYNYTAATFGYENITNSLVTVNVADYARRAVRSIVDISMFIRTRQPRGQIFYLGSRPSALEETYIAAQLENGELLVKIQFNGPLEAYTVGGVKLDNGYNHLIEVIRNVTLVQVKLNGTEYFRKTISATGMLDAQVLYLGGMPPLRSTRQTNELLVAKELTPPTAPSVAPVISNGVHFKGIIQDVQISNGSSIMVVEFFPLQADSLDIPAPFGRVEFDNSTVLKGVRSDNSCRVNHCHHGTCENTWNDYRCICPRGYKGKVCNELEFCELEGCPQGSLCKNLEDSFECISNSTFNGLQNPMKYTLAMFDKETNSVVFDSLEVNYRTRSWGTVLFAKHKDDYFVVFIYHNEVVIEWMFDGNKYTKRFMKERFEGQWLSLLFIYKDKIFKGGFKEHVMDESHSFEVQDFDLVAFTQIFKFGEIFVAGSDNVTFDYMSIIRSANNTMTGYIPASDTTTADMLISNSLENYDGFVDDVLYKVDKNKTTDNFKGCLGEIRIGGLLLPYFKPKEIYHNQTYQVERFELDSDADIKLGCILCYDTDCFNKGYCVNSTETYKCNCQAGYAADDCSIDINECENNQCRNNATCHDLVAAYECECLAGFEGEFCEKDIDECASNPCRHGGTCNDLIGTFKCDCPEGYVGKQCEAPLLITCDNKPCGKGATCKTGPNEQTGNNFTCTCAEGMVGVLCDAAFCEAKGGQGTCENDGTCNKTGTVPYCECARGFKGKYCEINIDECVSPTGGSMCQNGGICIDGIARYDCNCTGTGYTGLLCEIDIDECLLNPLACGSAGKCENLPGSCICDTIKGKCGHQCDLDDPCQGQNPCEHGTCQSQCTEKPDYLCICEENYTGKNCTAYKVAASHSESDINILYIIIPVVLILMVCFIIGMAYLVNIARSKRATRGTYSPSAQEFCNPRVELDHVLKPPPEERLI
nr:unnamed protein product [Callosobruchus chinensis]